MVRTKERISLIYILFRKDKNEFLLCHTRYKLEYAHFGVRGHASWQWDKLDSLVPASYKAIAVFVLCDIKMKGAV